MNAQVLQFIGRGGKIRTHDPLLPKPISVITNNAIYQALSVMCIMIDLCTLWQITAIFGHNSAISRRIYGTQFN